MKQTLLSMVLLTALFLIGACTNQNTVISSFEECVAAGNPVMESYPRQCRANDQTFVEEIDDLPIDDQQFTNDYTVCPDERPEICTMEYNPVCAVVDNGVRCITAPCASTDAITKATGCTACADQNVMGYYSGACEDNRFVVCEESFKGFDIEQMAQENGWICVDICPGNYDSYVTQIGSTMCIQHYGVEEISLWNTCEASTESCNCVKAYETTTDEPIENAQYRCVPDQYADRLLFRGGVDRLDENGDQSVMIA